MQSYECESSELVIVAKVIADLRAAPVAKDDKAKDIVAEVSVEYEVGDDVVGT